MNFIVNESEQKLRGGYYTPLDLAVFLARWATQNNAATVLEPSCGDGVFLGALSKFDKSVTPVVTGFELDPAEARKSRSTARRAGLRATVHNRDFLSWSLNAIETQSHCFDAVVGNPPFIRYQYLPPEFQKTSERIFEQLELKFTKHTNAWVPFILAAFALLRPGGRLAMVVPSEIIHVGHAQSLRAYLGSQCNRLVIIDPEALWFTGTLQGAVLLLAEKLDVGGTAQGLGIVSVKDREFLDRDPQEVFRTPQSINGKTIAGKWTRALLDPSTRSLIDDLAHRPGIFRFDSVASVDVGIVTGANKFFLVTDEVVQEYRLDQWAHPMFGRSEHCPGVIYDTEQHSLNAQLGNPTNFLWFNAKEVPLTKHAKAYIRLGEEQNLHTRFKCRVRSPWYTVPSVHATDVGMLKRAHDTPRLILNKARAYTTDTAYRIRTDKFLAERLVGSFLNPLTAVSAELEGRHYGGGVLELVPSEIEKLLLAIPENVDISLQDLDRAVKSGPILNVLDMYGSKILSGLGISRTTTQQLLDAWHILRNRRRRIPSETMTMRDD